MAGRLRVVDFTDEHARALLEQLFPQKAEKIRPVLIRLLAYEKAPPIQRGGRFFWAYEMAEEKFCVGFIMEVPGDPYSKIQIKTIEKYQSA